MEKSKHFKPKNEEGWSIKSKSKALSPEEKHKEFLLRNIDIINDILEALYESPDHGNKPDPMDELIYIHLSKKTNEKGYTEAFNRLSTEFPGWKALAEANPACVKRLIESAGLGDTRTEELLSNVKEIKKKFKRETLNPIKSWHEKRIFDFLTGLKGIGPKSARCIMMYSLGKNVFPVDTHVHTICERMGFIKRGLNHKIAQKELAEMFPKAYRYSLHVNMVAHGREVCKEQGEPLCDICHLNKFCYYFRSSNRKLIKKSPNLIDLFCGSGGASLGFIKAGFDIKLAIDNNIKATDTYYLNHPALTFDEIHTSDIRDLSDGFLRGSAKEKIDLVIGGPPCQGWSNIGKNRKNGNNGKDFREDERNALYTEFVRQLDNFKPRYFVMENVPGLLTAHSGKYAKIIQEDFCNHKYESDILVLNAADYGLPQNRKRIFFIGRRIDRREGSDTAKQELSRVINFIKEKKTEKRKSFRDAIVGLPHLEHGEGANVTQLDGNKLQGTNEIPNSEGNTLLFNHFARRHNPRDLEIYKLLSEGEDYLDFSKRTKTKDLLPYSNQSFHTKFRKINGNQPCCTVISHLSRDANSYIHPDDNRGITVREAARIQSFPDGFIFLDNGFRQFIQVGNAVPPGLAEIIGNAIMEVIKTRGEQNG